jgi:lysyl-tRNA synthetase class 2
LRTSPEFACKKLLAAGETRIFDFARVFRNRERGALHHPEFTLLEWYRANEPYETLMDDCAALMAEAARAVGAKEFSFRGKTIDRCRSAGDGQQRAGRSDETRGRGGQGRRDNRR